MLQICLPAIVAAAPIEDITKTKGLIELPAEKAAPFSKDGGRVFALRGFWKTSWVKIIMPV